MKKVGIVTINDYNNYGNRLQNYALQETLKTLGCTVKTVVNIQENTLYKANKESKINLLLKKSPRTILMKVNNKIWKLKNKKRIEQSILNRSKNFDKFTRQFIAETDYKISKSDIPEEKINYFDYFIAGSDQIWNPYFRGGSSVDFLTFASQNKRISYAASFGISELPNEIIDDYKSWLREMSYISVREEDGATIVNDLINQEVPIHVDPTLLLSKEKWLQVSKPSMYKPKEEYLLTYFLGGINSEELRKIEKIAKSNHLKVVNLMDITSPDTYETGPSEFLDLINSASIFCTNSFHGVVFSIIFSRPFIVFKRGNMNSRIETLLSKFQLENRKASKVKNSELFKVDFSHIPEILDKEKERSFSYLKKSLETEV